MKRLKLPLDSRGFCRETSSRTRTIDSNPVSRITLFNSHNHGLASSFEQSQASLQAGCNYANKRHRCYSWWLKAVRRSLWTMPTDRKTTNPLESSIGHRQLRDELLQDSPIDSSNFRKLD
jgi:hypothetical protein